MRMEGDSASEIDGHADANDDLPLPTRVRVWLATLPYSLDVSFGFPSDSISSSFSSDSYVVEVPPPVPPLVNHSYEDRAHHLIDVEEISHNVPIENMAKTTVRELTVVKTLVVPEITVVPKRYSFGIVTSQWVSKLLLLLCPRRYECVIRYGVVANWRWRAFIFFFFIRDGVQPSGL
ncbi:hypothetical protein V6N13_125672 [Hibiscus sabdariffa]